MDVLHTTAALAYLKQGVLYVEVVIPAETALGDILTLQNSFLYFFSFGFVFLLLVCFCQWLKWSWSLYRLLLWPAVNLYVLFAQRFLLLNNGAALASLYLSNSAILVWYVTKYIWVIFRSKTFIFVLMFIFCSWTRGDWAFLLLVALAFRFLGSYWYTGNWFRLRMIKERGSQLLLVIELKQAIEIDVTGIVNSFGGLEIHDITFLLIGPSF